VADLFDNIHHLPRHSLVSAYDNNDEFEDPSPSRVSTFDSTDTTSKRTLFLQKLQGVKSKLAPSFFMKDLEMEEDIDCDYRGGDA
jgi:hypothetical protein